MKSFHWRAKAQQRTFWALLLLLGGVLHFSAGAAGQGTGEWDGVMSPQAEEHLQLGRAAMSRGEWKQAQRELWKALEYTPKAVPVFNSLGEVYLATGEVDRAVVNLRIAIALGPLYAPAYANMGRALERRKDLVGARDFYEGALRLQTKWPEIRLALASVLAAQGDASRAKVEFGRVLESEPGNAEARYQLGLVLLTLNDAKSAAKELQRVVEARPKDARAWPAWGRALQHLDLLDEAEAAFTKARELDPSIFHTLPHDSVETPAK